MGDTVEQQAQVLVVGKLALTRQLLRRQAAEAGYEVRTARTIAQALGQADRCPAEALICHVQGTGASTMRLLGQLRERQTDACLILVGPDHGAERTADLLRAGAFDYLTIPIQTDRLKQSLRQGLETRRSFIQVRELSEQLRTANHDLAQERDSLRQWNRNLVALNDLIQTIAGTLDPDEIVRTVGAKLRQVLDIQLLGILWLQPQRVWVEAPAIRDQQVVEQTTALLLAEASTGCSGDPTPGSSGHVLDLPLMAAKERVGLMRLQRERGRPFDGAQVEFIKAITTSVALALRNAEAHCHVQTLAMTDGLTNLLNRRAFANILAREFREAERYRTPLCLIMADVDHFKGVNDQFGHPIGDRLLREVATVIGQAIRAVDVLTRFGGEEFAIILPRTDVTQAAILANRIRERIEQYRFLVNGARVGLTASMGLAQVPDPHIATVDELVSTADAALYQAKALGRNRIEVSRVDGEAAARTALYHAENAGVGNAGARC
ncbi:MAG: diguanylate cyclase [Nitrospirota bacterium]